MPEKLILTLTAGKKRLTLSKKRKAVLQLKSETAARKFQEAHDSARLASPAATFQNLEPATRSISPLAMSAGKTPHAWMVEALEVQTALAERRREFVASAHAAEQEVAKYGLVYEADAVFTYIENKVAGNKPKRPKPVKRT